MLETEHLINSSQVEDLSLSLQVQSSRSSVLQDLRTALFRSFKFVKQAQQACADPIYTLKEPMKVCL